MTEGTPGRDNSTFITRLTRRIAFSYLSAQEKKAWKKYDDLKEIRDPGLRDVTEKVIDKHWGVGQLKGYITKKLEKQLSLVGYKEDKYHPEFEGGNFERAAGKASEIGKDIVKYGLKIAAKPLEKFVGKKTVEVIIDAGVNTAFDEPNRWLNGTQTYMSREEMTGRHLEAIKKHNLAIKQRQERERLQEQQNGLTGSRGTSGEANQSDAVDNSMLRTGEKPLNLQDYFDIEKLINPGGGPGSSGAPKADSEPDKGGSNPSPRPGRGPASGATGSGNTGTPTTSPQPHAGGTPSGHEPETKTSGEGSGTGKWRDTGVITYRRRGQTVTFEEEVEEDGTPTGRIRETTQTDDGPKTRIVSGEGAKDSDGDGVPDYADSHPEDQTRNDDHGAKDSPHNKTDPENQEDKYPIQEESSRPNPAKEDQQGPNLGIGDSLDGDRDSHGNWDNQEPSGPSIDNRGKLGIGIDPITNWGPNGGEGQKVAIHEGALGGINPDIDYGPWHERGGPALENEALGKIGGINPRIQGSYNNIAKYQQFDNTSNDGGIKLEEWKNTSSDTSRQEFDLSIGDFTEADGLVALRKDSKGNGIVMYLDGETDAITKYGKAVGDNSYNGWEQMAAERVNETNKVVWIHNTGKMAYWSMDENWDYQSHEIFKAGSQGYASAENEFATDFNKDGILGFDLPSQPLA